jgi:hypothetical protein
MLSCAITGPKNLKDVAEDYETIKGFLVVAPVLENGDERLFFYVKQEESGSVTVCVAENDRNEDLLRRLAKKAVLEEEQPLFIYGTKVEGKYREYLEGVDYRIFAVSYYNPRSKRYMTVITDYGNRTRDVLRSIGWRNFLKEIAKRGAKAALP